MSKKKHFRTYIPKIIGGLILLAAIGYVVKIISNFTDEGPKHEKKIQPITILKPPPPPPPPPKVEPPPPEQEKVEQKLEEPEPEPEPLPDVAEQPAGDTGLDAEGVAGSDAFGLAARKGGKGLLGGGNPNAWYAGTIKSSLVEILSEHDELRKKNYTAIVKIWLNPDGSVSRFDLAKGSNDPDIDKLLEKLLGKFKKADEAPPPGMEQPIKFKISSRL
jgi:protein TonB